MVQHRDKQSPTYFLWMMVIILLAAAALRFHHLDFQSLWIDELLSWETSSLDTLPEVLTDIPLIHKRWPPAYYILLHYAIKLTGDSEFSLRYPSALAGILVVAASYPLVTRLFNRRTAITAVLLFTLMKPLIYYSQEARAYSLLIFFIMITFYFWLLLIEDHDLRRPPNRSLIIKYLISALACAYLHYYGAFWIALQGLGMGVYSLVKSKGLRRTAAIYLGITLGYLIWIPNLIRGLGVPPRWMGPPEPYLFSLGSYIVSALGRIPALAVICFLLIFIHLITTKHESKQINSLFLLFLWLLLPFTLIYTKSVISSPALNDRYISGFIPPAFYILLAYAITPNRISRLKYHALLMLISAILLWTLIVSLAYYTQPQKTQIREAVAMLSEVSHRYPEEEMLVIGGTHTEFFGYYYQAQGIDSLLTLQVAYAEELPIIEAAIQAQDPRYIIYLWADSPLDAQIIEYFEQRFTLIEHHQWRGAALWVFEDQSAEK